MTRCRNVPSAWSRPPTRTCSASAVPMRTSTDGISSRVSMGVSVARAGGVERGDDAVPEPCQGVRRPRLTVPSCQRDQKRRHELLARHGVGRANRLPRHFRLLVFDERLSRSMKCSGTTRQQTRGFGTIPHALRAVAAGPWPRESARARRRGSGRPGRREKCRHPGANREVVKVADLLERRSGSTFISRDRYSNASVRTPMSGSRSSGPRDRQSRDRQPPPATPARGADISASGCRAGYARTDASACVC